MEHQVLGYDVSLELSSACAYWMQPGRSSGRRRSRANRRRWSPSCVTSA